MKEEQLFTFIETKVFTKQLDKIDFELLFVIQNDLITKPKRGDLIAGTNGVRKARVADKKSKRGKSGSYRYMYLYLENNGIIYLLVIFPKSKKANLDKSERNEIAQIARQIKNIYKE
ncbi:MAG: type II toxin-antitoxin system RelE/ParE family toxin [Aridibacter sp.]